MRIAVPPVHLPRELEEDLAGMDDKARQETNEYMVEDLEDCLFEREHGDRIKAEAEAIRRGEIKTHPLDELTRELGFDPDELRTKARAEAAGSF